MANKNFVLPAEWEPQQGIQLTWPHAQTDWKPYLDDITKTFIDMAKFITLDEKLFIVTPEPAHVKRLLADHLNDEQRANIRYFEMPTNDTWARDHGAITLSNAYLTSNLMVGARSLIGKKTMLSRLRWHKWGPLKA